MLLLVLVVLLHIFVYVLDSDRGIFLVRLLGMIVNLLSNDNWRWLEGRSCSRLDCDRSFMFDLGLGWNDYLTMGLLGKAS